MSDEYSARFLRNADDTRGFNQMQRGAGPGGNLFKGDLGVVGFVDARVHKHANVSVNFGYILTSNEKSKLMKEAVLLDRPNEMLIGVGLDFPVNKHFQPIAELRTTRYVGDHTQNAFGNNPVEVLGGVKIFPRGRGFDAGEAGVQPGGDVGGHVGEDAEEGDVINSRVRSWASV